MPKENPTLSDEAACTTTHCEYF